MRKIMYIIVTIVMILTININPVYADTNTQNNTTSSENTEKSYDYAEDGTYDLNKNNSLAVMQSLFRVLGVCFILGGLVKFLLGKVNDNSPDIVAGVIMIVLGIVAVFSIKALVTLGILTKS